MSDSDLTRASGLWLRDGKRGGKFMSGKVETEIAPGSRLLVFKNDRKRGDNDPDYVLYVTGDESQPTMRRPEPAAQPAATPSMDDDLPF